jgi:hypothetical protein
MKVEENAYFSYSSISHFLLATIGSILGLASETWDEVNGNLGKGEGRMKTHQDPTS